MKHHTINKAVSVALVCALILFFAFALDSLVLNTMLSLYSPLIQNIMSVFSNVFFVLLILAAASFFHSMDRKKLREKERGALWLSIICTIIVVYALKFIISRDRPIEAVYLFGLKDYSFPSLHTAIVFSVIPFLDRIRKSYKVVLFSMIVLVALSRLFLLKHFFSDVIAGAMIGFFIAKAVEGWMVK